MIYKKPSDEPGKVRVTFELPSAIWADRVHLCGDFNDWSETATPLLQSRDDGAWRVMLELDTGRRYQFRRELRCTPLTATIFAIPPEFRRPNSQSGELE